MQPENSPFIPDGKKSNKVFYIEIGAVILFIIFYIFIFYFLNILNIRDKFTALDFIPSLQKNTSTNTVTTTNTTIPTDNFHYDATLAKKYLTEDLVDYLQPKYFPDKISLTQSLLLNGNKSKTANNFFGLNWVKSDINFYAEFKYALDTNTPSSTVIGVSSFNYPTNSLSPTKSFQQYFKSSFILNCTTTKNVTFCQGEENLANKDNLNTLITIAPKKYSIFFCHIYNVLNQKIPTYC